MSAEKDLSDVANLIGWPIGGHQLKRIVGTLSQPPGETVKASPSSFHTGTVLTTSSEVTTAASQPFSGLHIRRLVTS